MTDIHRLVAENEARWHGMVLDPKRLPEMQRRAGVLVAPENKARFQAVEKRVIALGLKMHWWFVAVCAEREYGGPPHWDRQLAQGDPLNETSRHDPAGRGPFLGHPTDTPDNDPWARACLDALIDCAPHAAHWPDWTPGGVLTLWEEYNGLGYAARGVPSAYVWSGSNQYVSGKYVADHVYRSNVVDVQEGCAPLIKVMAQLDTSISFGQDPVPGVIPPRPIVIPKATPPHLDPTPGPFHPSLWELLVEAYKAL